VRRLVRDRRYGPFFWGCLVSHTGTWLQSVTAVLVVFGLTGSATAVGLVATAQYAGHLLLGPAAGQLADRFERRGILLVAQTAGLSGAVWLVAAAAGGLASPAPIYIGLAVTGAAQAVSVPVMHALVPMLVPAADLVGAIALQSLTYNFSRAVGPALGAATLVAAGPSVAFAVNAVTYLAMLGGILAARPLHRPGARTPAGRLRVARFLRAAPVIARRLLLVAAVSFAIDPVTTLAPSVVAQLGGGDRLVGLLVSAFGAGAAVTVVVAVPLIRRFGERVAIGTGMGILAAGLVGFGNLPAAVAVAGVLFVAGVGFMVGQTALTTSIQQGIPDPVRGRVMAVWAIMFLGTRPLAGLANGALADIAGAHLAVLVPALALVLCAAVAVAPGPRAGPEPATRAGPVPPG
jgi:MFS family permease